MRVALFVESTPSMGCFRQSLSAVHSLCAAGALNHDVIVFTPSLETRQRLLQEGIEAVLYRRNLLRLVDRWSSTVVGAALLGRLRRLGFKRLGRHLDGLLDDHRIDVAILNEDAEAALRIGDHPFLITVWDLDYRDHPEFPEWFADRGFERQERLLAMTLPRALGVIANSASGARRIASLYNVDPSRIVQFPYLPSLPVRQHAAGKGSTTVDAVRRKYGLPEAYVFYPAFFAAHKNHLYVMEGLIELERTHGIVAHAVFCGGEARPGCEARVKRQAHALGLETRVRFLGLVPDAEVPALYEGAMALVMPTYFGPTNLPPLEAVALGCPVVYSDLPGCREQMGEAALYCDLSDPAHLADLLHSLMTDDELRGRLKEAARRMAEELERIDYGERLGPLLDEYANVRRRWAWPPDGR